MNWLDYRKKLGIDFEDEERGARCSSLILNKLDDMSKERIKRMDFVSFVDFDAVSEEEYKIFCATTGTEYGNILSTPEMKIRTTLALNKPSFKSFLSFYIAFINCLSNRKDGIQRSDLLDLLDSAFNESNLKYALLKDDDKYFVFPKGAKELDDALISEPLMWLKDYSNSRKAFTKALKAYSEATEENASDVADLFRKALETFFQEFFGKDKSLENLKSEYGNFLSKKGVPGEIKNNFEKLLESYTNYNNNYAKHHDKASLNVLEYIMYQTGNLIRLIITLNQEDDVNAD